MSFTCSDHDKQIINRCTRGTIQGNRTTCEPCWKGLVSRSSVHVEAHKAMVCGAVPRSCSWSRPALVKILSNSIRPAVPARYLPEDNIEIRRTCQRPNGLTSRRFAARLRGWRSRERQSGHNRFRHAPFQSKSIRFIVPLKILFLFLFSQFATITMMWSNGLKTVSLFIFLWDLIQHIRSFCI